MKVHPALAGEWWSYSGRLKRESALPTGASDFPDGSIAQLSIIRVGEFELVPLFPLSIDVTCHLDILFLRRSKPGGIIHEGGDLDNRMLTLFDALKTPKVPSDFGPRAALPKPFYCLLDEDSQISGFSVRTGQLLHSMRNTSADVRLVIDVTVEVRRVTWANLDLLGE